MALQDTLVSQDANAQNVHILASGQQQQASHAIMSMGHELAAFGANEHAQTNVRVSIIPTLMQSPQSIVSTHAHMSPIQVTPSSMSPDATSAVQVHSIALQNPKEDHSQREQERRVRREIANSNERRRMQSINAGFKSLKSILPHTEGEKLSKAAILQQTSDYISQLESDKLKLHQQIEKLKRALTECKCNPSKHVALADIFEKDEGIGSPAEEDYEDMKRGISEVKQQLDKERRMRKILEQHIQQLDSRLYPQNVQAVPPMSDKDDSQSIYRTVIKEDHGVKAQPCARTLLPPLAPLGLPKCEPPNEQSHVKSTLLPPTSAVLMKNDAPLSGKLSIPVPDEVGVCVTDGAKVAVSSPQSDHLVTVFSHSNKSNQPLKKRAIEILEVHQNAAEAGCDTISEQPKMKLPRMSLDHLPSKENIMMISHTHSPRPESPLLASNAKMESIRNGPNIDKTQSRPAMSLPALALSLPDATVHFPQLSSSSSLQGLQKTMYRNMLSPCPLPTDAVSSSKHSPISSVQNTEGKTDVISTKVQGIAAQAPQTHMDIVTYVNGNHTLEGTPPVNAVPGHVYLTVNGSSNIAYVQQEGDKSLPVHQHFQQPQYIIAPQINTSCNGLVVGTSGLDQSHSGMQLISHPGGQSQPLQPKLPPAIVTYPQPTSHPTVTHSVQVSQPFTLVQNNAAHLTFRTKHLQNQQAGTLLCYSQPEITLNQLNAVPNLAPPKSLHQPVMSVPVGSPLVVPNVASESPYIIPSVHENAIPSKSNAYMSPAALRCRKSSLSTADSCSTASASGTEEEEATKVETEHNDSQQPGLFAKKVSKSLSNPLKPVALEHPKFKVYDDSSATISETATVPTDIEESSSSSRSNTLSALTNATTSPPVIRHVDSMQSRGNLETIVQAIDHLEQQERRNSQDVPETLN